MALQKLFQIRLQDHDGSTSLGIYDSKEAVIAAFKANVSKWEKEEGLDFSGGTSDELVVYEHYLNMPTAGNFIGDLDPCARCQDFDFKMCGCDRDVQRIYEELS